MGDVSRLQPVSHGRMVDTDPEIEDLKARLAQAEDTIRAIYHGEVDALVVNGPLGPQVYTLEGADHPYRVLVEHMHEGTVTLDSNNLVLYSNRQFAAMMGARAESITGSSFAQFLSDVDSNLFFALMEAAEVRGHSSGELNLRASDRDMVPVRLSVTRLETEGLQTTCVVASDLREQRQNEAMIKAEQLSRLMLEQAGEAIVVIDPQGCIVRRSESAKALAGRHSLLEHFDRIFRLDSAGSPFNAQRILSAAWADEHIRGLEVNMVHPDRPRSSLLVSVSPLWSDAKELLGSVVTLTDITQRKRAEEALTRQASELARSNGDLRQFAYSASHDLREPLRQVALFSEMLEEKCRNTVGDEAGMLIRHIMGAAHRMEALLKDLLAYIQAADAPQEVPSPTDANEVARRTIETFEAQIAESGGQIEVDSLPVLDVHEAHLTQLFQNLIGNALKYRSERPPVIRIAAESGEGIWTLSVADNGIGIEPDYQSQIFGLFQRLHGGGKYAGSGIGLAICQKIVQRYGGRIWVESNPGAGSRFLFTLPGAKL